MPLPLLQSKLFVPPARPVLVPRPHLLDRLNRGLHRKLTLISAPAGSGKTTLLSEWVTGLERRAAWLSLDEGDNDLARFLTYLVAAMQRIDGVIGEGMLPVLQSPQLPPIETILTALLNDIGALPDPVVLVLDDYHFVDAKPVDDALTFLLEHLPPQLHLVIATREDPQLPLARLRARDQLTAVRAADLRFTPTEAAAFLNQVMGLNLSVAEIDALEERTEGWVAGLQLAALSMRGHPDASAFIQAFSGSHQFVLDYLLEEVLEQQSDRVQTFLLHTSILERLCGSLCDAVLLDSSGSGQATLEYLDHANLFLVPLDNERRWYRYHHLFRDLLRQRLQQRLTASAGDEVALHRRASMWYERNALPFEAIRHAFAAEDLGRAAGLVELETRAMLTTRQDETLLGWLKALPAELVRARPVLSVYYALALVSGDLEAAEARLRDAERVLDMTAHRGERPESPAVEMLVVDEEGFRSLPGTIAIVRAYLAGALDDVSGSVNYARQALDLLPEDDHLWRGAAAALLGLAYWNLGDLEAAHQSYAAGMARLQMTADSTHTMVGAFILADIRTAQGRLREAQSIYEQSLKLAAEQGKPVPLPTADLYVGMSELHREHNDLEAASQCLLKSKELDGHGWIPENRYRWYVAMARITESHGDFGGALVLLNEAERLYIRSPDPYVHPVVARKARVWVRQGRLAEALEWAREQGLSSGDDLSYVREFEHITLARVLIARSKSDLQDGAIHEAMSLLERLLHAAEEGGRMGSVIEILVLQALAYEAQGNVARALAPMKRALALAEPEGYVRIFVDEGTSMVEVLRRSERQAEMLHMRRYIRRLLAACAEQEDVHSFVPAQDSRPSVNAAHVGEPLSERELEVLHLIAQGLSNREMSERLFLALDTIKGHNRRIFGKLQVQRRTEAVARARELGLL